MKKEILIDLYQNKKLSVSQISNQSGYSQGKINYWLLKHKISKRSISDAVYLKIHPTGDPFSFNYPKTTEDVFLYGLGLGLYWGEGTKASPNSVRLGNSDPDLLNTFIKFLFKIYKVRKVDLRFGLQIFEGMKEDEALEYWCRVLSVNKNKFYKVIFKKPVGKGTYKNKNIKGVITIYYNNVKLRNALCDNLKKMSKNISIVGKGRMA